MRTFLTISMALWLGVISVRAATSSLVYNTAAPVTTGALTYSANGRVIQDSPIRRVNATTVSLTNEVVSGNLVRGISALSGVSPTTDWTVADRFSWTLSAASTNTHSNVPTGGGTAQCVSIVVTGNGVHTVDFVFPGGVTTNWTSTFVRIPRIGQTEFGFCTRGSTVDIWAWPDSYALNNNEVYRRASGTNGFGQVTLSSGNAVSGTLGVANGGTGSTTSTGTGATVLSTAPTFTNAVAATGLQINTTGTQIKGVWSAAAALNFGSIASLGSADLTITVTGAAVGDSVAMGLPAAPTAGIVFNAFVSAASTITIRAHNYTLGAIDPASATYRATVSNF